MSSFASLKAARSGRLGRSGLVPGPDPSSSPPAQPPTEPEVPASAPVATTPIISSSTSSSPASSPPVPSPTGAAPASPERTTPASPESSRAGLSHSSTELYPDLGSRVEVRLTADRGRGVFSVKRHKVTDDSPSATTGPAYKPGERILSLQPHAQALSTTSLRTTCDGCLLALHELRIQRPPSSASEGPEVLLLCGGCRLTRYCSKACQAASWAAHKAECRGLSSIRAAYLVSRQASGAPKVRGEWIPIEAVRALGRLASERRRRREANGGKDDLWWEQIASLQSHRASLPMMDLKTAKPTAYAQLAISLAVYLGHCFPPPADADGEPGEMRQADMADFGFAGVGEVMELCCAFMTNSFTLSSPSLTPIGVAINPTVALCNHSCWPNAAVIFPSGGKGGMQVVAIRPIREDEEILTSYVDISLPASLRKQALRNQYHFDCACELCTRGSSSPLGGGVDPREAVVGTLEGIEEWVRQGMAVLTQDEKGLITTLDDARERHLLPIVQSLVQVYAPTAYPLFPLLRLLSTVLLTALPTRPDVLTDALALACLVASAISHPALYPPGHPARAVALAEFGKLLLVPPPSNSPSSSSSSLLPDQLFPTGRPSFPDSPVGRLAMAREVLIKALEELRIGFGGDGGLVGLELRGLVEGVGREIQGLLATQSQRSLPM